MNNIHSIVKYGENISPKNRLPVWAGVTDNKDLTKNHASGQPFRYLSAFFMPEICPATQTGHNDSITHLTQITGLNHHIFMAMFTKSKPAVYDGVTLQNKPLWQICRAVACVTESEPHHPMNFHSVVTTQNLTQGGHNHA